MAQQLPIYYKNSRPTGPGGVSPVKKCKEVHLLAVLFITFIIVWAGLVTHIPEVRQPEGDFQDAYKRFTSNRNLHGFIPENENGLAKPPEGNDNNPALNAPETPQTRATVEEQRQSTTATPEAVTVAEEHRNEAGPEDNNPPDNQETESPAATEDDETTRRREKVKEMIAHAWRGYYRYAMGENELKPISKRGHSAVVFGSTKVGATVVDSLDTLYIAGLMEEYQQGRDWVEQSLHFEQITSYISVFEFNIRFVGGLLSAYALTGDEVFKTKAADLARKLLPAFNTGTGIPKSLINLKNGAIKNWGWASGGSSVLAEIGSLHLEFQYLTEITGDPIFLQKVNAVRSKLRSLPKSDGLYPNFIKPDSGAWGMRHLSLGALGDSFYEYLLKAWLVTSKDDTEGRDMFYETLGPIENKLLHRQGNGFLMVNDLRNGRPESKMQHLACFSGGMFALASVHATDGKGAHYMDIGKDITKTCHESYQTASNLGAEAFRFDGGGQLTSRSNEKVYLLRPETVESYFYLWRLTKDPKYREWGWEAVQALEKSCRVDNGYSGIRDVYNAHSSKDDVQQSFFIAETLKYLYLLFSDDSVIPLDQWVFNTEAHPFPVLKGIPSV